MGLAVILDELDNDKVGAREVLGKEEDFFVNKIRSNLIGFLLKEENLINKIVYGKTICWCVIYNFRNEP